MSKLKATTERCVICLGGHWWGSGKTEQEAVRHWRKENGSLSIRDRGQKEVEVVIIDAPASFYVSEMTGAVVRHEDSPPSRELRRMRLKI